MTVSPRKRMSIVGTRSLRGGKITINEEDFVGGSFSFKELPAPSRGGAIKKKVSPKVSPIAIKKRVSPIANKKKVSPIAIKKKVSPSAITKKVSPKTKARRTSSLLRRLELPDEPTKLSPIMARRTRRKSMASLSTHKTEVTETVKISRSISDKSLPASKKPKSKPPNKASAKPPASKPLPPKVPASKSSTTKNSSKSASPTSPKETSPKNIKKTEVSTKVTVKSTKMTRATSKTGKKSASAEVTKAKENPRKSVSPTVPKETSPKNKKNEDPIKVTVKSAKTTKITKTVSKTETKSASPEGTKPKEVTFSPVKFYSSPKKTATPTKRRSFTISIDKEVSFTYSPVANKKRKFDGSPTPEAISETKLKKQKIEKSSTKKSKLPKPEKKDKTPKSTPKITRAKTVGKTLRVVVSPLHPQKKSPPKSIKKPEVIVPKADVKLSPEIKKPTTKTTNKKTPETKTQAPKSDKKKSVKKTPESIKSIKSSSKKQTTSPKVSQNKTLQSSVSKTTKKVKISADSPDGSAVEYRKTPKSDKHMNTDSLPDIGASPELKPAVDLLASIRASPIISKVKLKPYTPKPDPTPSRVLKQTMKRKANKDLHLHAIKMKAAAKMIEPSKLVDSEIVVMKTPVQLTRTPLRKTAPVSPETPSSASNLPPTPTSSRKTLSVKRNRSVARRELLTRPSPPRSSTPIEEDGSLEPQIADPDITDINDEIVVKEISTEVTATQILTTEFTSKLTGDEDYNGGVEKDDNGVVTTIVSEDNVSECTDINGSVLVKSSQDDDPPRKSNWRYCSVM